MRQAILVAPKQIEFKQVEAPKAADLQPHQVLIQVKRIGICGSEIHSYHGLHPPPSIRSYRDMSILPSSRRSVRK